MNFHSIDQHARSRKSEADGKRQQNVLLLTAVACLFGLVVATPAIAVVAVTGDVSPTPPAGGGTFSASTFRVGNTSIGTMSITDGTSLENTASSNNLIGDAALGIGFVTVDGIGSEWLMGVTSNGTLTVGDTGQGQLQILNGGRVRNDFATIADDAGSFGAVTGKSMAELW